jgi:hypothetical protein
MTEAFLQAPDSGAFKRAWLRRLCVPGTVVWCELEDNLAGMVLQTNYGVLMWMGQAAGWGHFRHFELYTTPKAWRQVLIYDPENWRVAQVTPKTPRQLLKRFHQQQLEDANLQNRICFEIEDTCSLLQHAAKHGFKEMGLKEMLLQWKFLEVPHRRPTLLLEVMEGLHRFVLGEQANVAQAGERRMGEKQWASIVEKHPELIKEVIDEKDDKEVVEPLQKKQREEAEGSRSERRPRPAQAASAQPAVAAASSSAQPAVDAGAAPAALAAAPRK